MKKNVSQKANTKEETEEIHADEEHAEGKLLGQGVQKSAEPTEKEKLLELYQTLKDLGINSIGDLELKISRL